LTEDCEIPDFHLIIPDRDPSAIVCLDFFVLLIGGIFGMRENDIPNITSYSGGIYASHSLSLH
jgi:hypothetical protein